MLNRGILRPFQITINTIYHYVISPIIDYTEHALFGKARQAIFNQDNLINNEMTPAAKNALNGVNTVRVGPYLPCNTRHLTVVVPKSKKLLIELLDEGIENDDTGRSIMNPFQYLLNYPSITNMTGHKALVERRKMLKYTGDIHGFKIIERRKFYETLKEWSKLKEGFVLLDEIKLLIRRVTYNRYINEEKEFSIQENNQVNSSFSGLKKVLLNPYSIFARKRFETIAKKYQEESKNFITKHMSDIVFGLEKKGTNILSDLITDDIKSESDINEIKKTATKKLNGSMLLMGSLDGVYINLISILFQLMEHPEIVTKLRVELDSASIGSTNERSINDEGLKDSKQLPYLNAIIKEGLRYTSSAPILPRYTKHGIHTEHFDIPRHSTILINMQAMHYDSSLWGNDANQFKPERFLKPDAPELHEYPFMPFITGIRRCPGVTVGLMTLKLFISELYLNYDLVPTPNQSKPRVDKTAALVMDIGPGYKVFLNPRERVLVSSHCINSPKIS